MSNEINPTARNSRAKSHGPPVLFVQVPGVDAEPLRRFLRAIFCYREAVPSGVSGAGRQTLAPPETDDLDAQYALAVFPGSSGARDALARLFSDPQTFVVAAVGDPLAVSWRVFRHLRATGHAAAESGFETFVAARANPVHACLAAAAGRRTFDPRDYSFLVAESRLDTGLQKLSRALLEHRARTGSAAPTNDRIEHLLRIAADHERDLCQRFGGHPGGGNPEIGPDAERAFRDANRKDYALMEKAGDGITRRRRAKRLGRMFPARRRTGRDVSSDPVFVFNHLPKCYGTSMRILLGTAFSVIEDHTEWLGRPLDPPTPPISLATLSADAVVCGHLCDGAFALRVRYPGIWENAGRYQLFSFVRDPLQTAVSNFRHVLRERPDEARRNPALYGSLDAYLLAQRDPLARRQGSTDGGIEEIFSRYLFIGAAEDHAAHVPRLFEAMGRVLAEAPETPTIVRARASAAALAQAELPEANRAPDRPPLVDPEVARKFCEQNPADYAIYARVRQRAG